MLSNKNGITLVSLVITIIVTVVIAGICITMAMNEDNVIGQAKIARRETNISKYREDIELITTSENSKFELNQITFDTQVNNIEDRIKEMSYVKEVVKTEYPRGTVLEVETDETVFSIDCRKNDIEITEGESQDKSNGWIYNYIVNEDNEIEIKGFNFDYDGLDYEMVYGLYEDDVRIINKSTLEIPNQIEGRDVVSVKFTEHINTNDYLYEGCMIYGINKLVLPDTLKYPVNTDMLTDVTEVIGNILE